MYNHFELTLFRDTLFRAILGQEKTIGALQALVNAVLVNAGEKPVKLERILNPFEHQELFGQKEPILDVKASDSAGQHIDIEVQIVDHKYFRERILYYWSRIYGEQLSEGKEYTKLKPVIGIVFVRFPIHAEYLKELWDTVELIYRRHHEKPYSDHLSIHFVTIPENLTEENSADINEELKHWLITMNYPRNKEQVKMIAEIDPEIAVTIERADKFLADPQVRYYLEAWHKAVTTQATLMATSREEGSEEGRADNAVKNVKKLLLRRFGQLSPAIIQALDNKVKGNPNEAECQQIFTLALDCASPEEFLASL